MASEKSIFKTHFILIVMVFNALVILSGATWVYMEYRSCTDDTKKIRLQDVSRFKKQTEHRLRLFASRIERLGRGLDNERFRARLIRSTQAREMEENGFVFLFFPETDQLTGRWHHKRHLVSVTALCDINGKPFLRTPCKECRRTGVPRWLDHVHPKWMQESGEWCFYLLPMPHRPWVVGTALDMTETTRTADNFMELAKKHLLHFSVGMALFLVVMLLTTLGVAYFLARKMSTSIKAYAVSLKEALENGKFLKTKSSQLLEFKKLSTKTNNLLKQWKAAEKQYRKLFETNAISIWVEDFSAVRLMLENLKKQGVTEPEAYFKAHPEFVKSAAKAIRILDVNRETLRIYGADNKEQLLSSLDWIFHSDSYEGFETLLVGLFRGKRIIRYEEVNRTIPGREIFFLITVTVDESEDFSHLIVSLVDITDRKEAEEALEEEKDRLAATLNSIADGVVVTDASGKIVMMNPAAGRMTGYDHSRVLGYPLEQVYRIITVGNGHEIDETTRLFFQDEEMEISGKETILVSENGSRYLIDESRSPIIGSKEKFRGMVIVFRDITELRKSQAQLARVKRLESLGLMAAGIAHDFNNVMTAVFGNISLARMLSDPGSNVAEKLGAAEQAIERARELTGRLITFSCGGEPVGKQIELSKLVRKSVKQSIGKNATKWKVTVTENIWPVKVDASQFVHVIANLAKNATEAMDGRGQLDIHIQNMLIGNETPPLEAGKYVSIIFSDSGSGIPGWCLDKIFDPYFTTREGAQGLGLSIAYGIVKRHGGHIRVESEPGSGSRFEILLPAL